ncbi:MAG: hypothetical protein IKP58_17470 [Victivallales bacterium]|nr:hypothetical protein [Victivallales bacterium]
MNTSDSNLTLFAWNGISFQVPKRWELAVNELIKGVSRIVLEDDYGPRLEIDWTTPRSKSETERFRKRSLEYIKIIDDKSSSVKPLDNLSDEWTAHLYRMPENASLATAYMVPASTGDPFVFFRIHFSKGTPEIPEATSRKILRSFSWTKDGSAQWAFYDIRFKLDCCFRLVSAALLAGQKLLAFEWKLRRLFVWHFSLADYITRNSTPAQWCADFLNKFKLLPAPHWTAVDDTTLVATRKKLYFLGQFEEIGRLCYKYHAICQHLPEQNMIRLVVFNYRSKKDLQKLKSEDFPC